MLISLARAVSITVKELEIPKIPPKSTRHHLAIYSNPTQNVMFLFMVSVVEIYHLVAQSRLA